MIDTKALGPRLVKPDRTERELVGRRDMPTHETPPARGRLDGRRSSATGATADHIVGMPAGRARHRTTIAGDEAFV
jgi:hypothetical protein